MAFFKTVEGEGAIVIKNGVFKQVPLATRDGYLYACVNGGYVRIMADGSTTGNGLRLDFMTFDQPLCRDKLGRLCTKEVKGAIALQEPLAQKLLGASDE